MLWNYSSQNASCRLGSHFLWAVSSQVQTFPVCWQKTTLKNLGGVWSVENLGMGKPAFTVLGPKMKI